MRGEIEKDQAEFATLSRQIATIAITVTLRTEAEAGLLSQAQASGMTLQEYLLSMVEGAALSAKTKCNVGGRACIGT